MMTMINYPTIRNCFALFNRLPRFALTLFLLLSATVAVFSQGTIEGLVVDKNTREPLLGATLKLEKEGKVAVTDMEGRYSFKQVKADTVSLTISYVSYARQTIEPILVETGKTTVVDIEMAEASIELNTIKVEGFKRTNTNLSMMENTKISFLVVNGISSQQIMKSLDRDAGEVARRVPGVTISDNRFVVIRGLNQRYNTTWLNDAPIPSSEADSRAFSFDAVPGSLIDNLLISKSPAPENPADCSGGFVRILTKSLPDNNALSVGVSLSYQDGSTFTSVPFMTTHTGDLLGLGTSQRNIPSTLPAVIRSSMPVEDRASYARQLQADWKPKQFTAMPDLRLSVTHSKQFNWSEMPVGVMTALNYSNSIKQVDKINKRFGIYQQSIDSSFAKNDYRDQQSSWQSKLSLLNNWTFTLSPTSRIMVRNFFNQIGLNRFTNRHGEDRNNDYTINEWEDFYMNRSVYAGQINGKHTFKNDSINLNWLVSYSFANRNEPGRRVVTSRLNEDESSTSFGEYRTEGNDIKRFDQALSEHMITGGSNLEMPLSIGSLSTQLKTGFLAEYKYRLFDARNFIYRFDQTMLPDKFVFLPVREQFTGSNLATNGITLKENTNKSDSYNADNQLYAAYAGMNIPLFQTLSMYAGLRGEYHVMRLSGYESDGIKPVNVHRSKLHLFPSVNFTAKFDATNQLRFSYGSTINRPEFREVAPYVYYDFEQFAFFEGNVRLKDATINNLDLRFEHYPTPGETVSLGFFAKFFQNPIEMTYFEVGAQQQFTYRNAEKAQAFGAELDVRKDLATVGLPHFTLVFNGSYIYSRVLFPAGSFERNRSMQGQSPYTLNTGFYYDAPDQRWRASALFNRSGKRIVTVGVVNASILEDIPDTYEMPRNLVDLSFSYRFSEKVECSLEVKDLLNEPVTNKQFPLYESKGKRETREQTTLSFTPGKKYRLLAEDEPVRVWHFVAILSHQETVL